MGKVITEQYSDVNNRILKNTKKRKKQLKRKVSCSNDNQEPVLKKSKTDFEIKENKTLETIKANTTLGKEVTVSNENFLHLELKDTDANDLFSADEFKNGYLTYPYKDFYWHIIEEICLEGLDGITLEAFWKRFLAALDCPLTISDSMKNIIWKIICGTDTFKFYALPEERGELQLVDVKRDKRGTVIDSPEIQDIYPISAIQDSNIRGSCSTYRTRLDVTNEVISKDLKTVEEEYGRRLVIVADQNSRNKILFDDEDPQIELQLIEYCMLERIGRSRKAGEITQGNCSIMSAFKIDAGSLFHYQKALLQNRWIKKQRFFVKISASDQYRTGNIVHLTRFYRKIKSTQLLIAEQIISILKARPNFRIPMSELRTMFPFFEPTLKVIKNPEFRKFLKTDVIYPYRELYPNATKREYSRKSDGVEKHIKCYELIDPHVNVAACWYQNATEDSDEDDDEEDDDMTGGSKIYNLELFREAYYHIFSKGADGLSQLDLQRLIGIDKKCIRMVLKKLLSKKVIFIKKCDVGKQRKLVYYAKCLEKPIDSVKESVSSQETSDQKVSKFKSKLIERQKAALAKKTRTQVVDEASNMPQETYMPFVKFQKLYAASESAVISLFIKKSIKISGNKEIANCNLRKFCRSFSIPLAFMPSEENTIPINKYLSEISILPQIPMIRLFENSKINSFKKEKMMTLILLKAHLGEVAIKDVINFVNRKRPHSEVDSPESAKKVEVKSHKKIGVGELNFMGEDPQTEFESEDGNVHVIIYSSTPPAEVNYNTTYPKKIDMSARSVSRYQIILDLINQKKIQEDFHKMVRHVMNEEAKVGLEEKIDRRSLARILRKLVIEGYIKIFQLVISNNIQKKSTYFICHPTVSHTDSLITSVLEQWKWKYIFTAPVPDPEPKVIKTDPEEDSVLIFKETDVLESIEKFEQINKTGAKLHFKFLRQISKVHGLKPKCVRMRILHELFFYLIYENKEPREPLSNNEVKNLFRSYQIDISDEDLKNMAPIYCKEISWKMFIPNLPEHKGWPDGWTLLCDIIFRLPISVFCQIHSCSYKLQELTEVLNHPIKRFYLLKDLSYNIRSILLFKRKYLSNIYDTLDRLAFCGLLQYGPQKCKMKDQSFIYLNRRASLLDTTTSEPSYHKITEKEYEQKDFYFKTQEDLDAYWYNVYVFCLNTKLNQKTSGQIITLVDISARPDLQEALVHRLPEEAEKYDTGRIYGDKRGAAGLDSSLWAHLARNWFWPSRKKSYTDFQGLHSEKMEKVLPHQIEYANLHQNSLSKVYLPSREKVPATKTTKGTTKTHVRTRPSKYFQKLIRKIKPRPIKSSKRQYYDALDMTIRKQNGLKTRVKFSQNEDDYLLLCLAAECFITPKANKKRVVYFTTIRDLMHRMCPESKNKTSRAIQRRIKILLNQNPIHYEEIVSNFMKHKEIGECFSQLCNKRDENPLTDGEVTIAFIFLTSYINKHRAEFMSALLGVTARTNYLTDTNLDYVEDNLIDYQEGSIKFNEPQDENDVKKDVLKSVIHSSLTSKNQPELALQLFLIYQQYPDELIRNAVEELRCTHTISSRRFELKKNRVYWQIPFKLSRVYILFQYATFNNTTAIQAYKTFLAILQDELHEMDFSLENIESKKYGQLLSINELFPYWNNISLQFYLPQSMVILNPSIKDHEELVNELAVRYQLQLKNMLQDSIREEQDPDKQNQTELEINFLEELNKVQSSKKKESIVEFPDISDDTPFDLTTIGGADTIDRLKHWVTDCMEEQGERRERSPSPQFFQIKDEPSSEAIGSDSQQTNWDQIKESNLKGFGQSQIPTLEEIKEGMLKSPVANEDRTIPYITELSGLLNKETCAELNTDEKRLEQLKNHFITHFAKLEGLKVNDIECFKQQPILGCLDQEKNRMLWHKIQEDVKVQWTITDVFELVREKGGVEDDCVTAIDIIEFIKQKEVLGAKGVEIKERFSSAKKSLNLIDILQILIDARVLLKTGICDITFVHFKYQCSWLIETFELTSEEEKCFREKQENDQEVIEQKLKAQQLINIKVAPWIQINGRVNEEVLKTWLCNILSHCLEYPKISFMKICEKFCHVKPIDIYHLLEILQQLECLDLFLYDNTDQGIFSEWAFPNKRRATILDNLESVIVETYGIPMTCLGSFFYNIENKCK